MNRGGKSLRPISEDRASLYSLFAILLLAAIFRLVALSDVAMTHDSFEYLDQAREIASGEFFERDYPVSGGLLYSRQVPPLFPATVALVHLAGLPLERAGLFIAILCDLVAVGFAFAIGRRMGGLGAAVFAGLIACGSLQHLSFSTRIITETMFGMWALGTLWATLRLLAKPRARRAAAAGAMAAAAYVTRENGLVLVALVGLSVGWIWVEARLPRVALARLAAGFIAAFIVVALPFWVEIRVRTGHFGLSLRDSVLTQVLTAGDDEGEHQATAASTLGRRAALVKTYLWRGFMPRLKRVQPWHSEWYVRVAFNCLLLVGIVLLFVFKLVNRRLSALVLCWAAGFFVSTILVAPLLFVARYNYPAVIIVEVLAGAGLAAGTGTIGRRMGPRGLGAAFLVVTVLLLAHLAWTAVFVHDEGQALARKSAAAGVEDAVRQCRPQLHPRPRVMDAKIFAAYYLDGGYLPLPGTPAELAAAIERERPDVVVIDSQAVSEKRPALAPLASGPAPEWAAASCSYFDPRSSKFIRFLIPRKKDRD